MTPEIRIFATVALNGVVGRTVRRCTVCEGSGQGMTKEAEPEPCIFCDGTGQRPAHDMPWQHYPEIAHRRKNLINNDAVLTGRREYLKLQCDPNYKENLKIVVSKTLIRDEESFVEGGIIASSFDALLEDTQDLPERIYVLGGASTFERAFDYASRIDLVMLPRIEHGDIWLPFADLFRTNLRHGSVRTFTDARVSDWDLVTVVEGAHPDVLLTTWVRR